MISPLESNLPAQIIVVLVSAGAFLIILEGFGYALLKSIRLVSRRLDSVPSPKNSLAARTFIGGLAYTLVFLVIGSAGYLTKPAVLFISCLVPILTFVLGRRWRELAPSHIKSSLNDNKYIIGGTLVFMALTFILWFRPIINFDGLWYHLEVPKLFLQNHSTENQGGLIFYSLQPSMDYFWNLWPLSLPVPTAIAGIVINSVQAMVLGISLAFASRVGRDIWGWGRFHQFMAPILLGATFETLSILGGGGNDLLGLAYGLVATIYCFYLLTKTKVLWYQLVCALLLIVGMATIKVFFTIYASLILMYLLVGVWDKLLDANNIRRQARRLAVLLLATFVLAYLPWLVRAYLATGRPLDPLGTPGLSALFYHNQGGGTMLNHWTNYIYPRFYSSIGPLLFFMYSPLVLVGLLSVLNVTIRKKASSLWVLAVVGYLAVFFASITLDWRYYLAQVTVLVFLGIAVLVKATQNLEVFGRLAVWAALFLLIGTAWLRVLFTQPDVSGFPNIQHDIYVSHFTNTDDYLNRKISDAYDYVQESSPRDLSADEKIFIGNTYPPIPMLYQPIGEYELRNIHNLSYIDNPVLEPTMDSKAFERVKTIDGLIALLRTNHIRYVLTRKNMDEVCKARGIKDHALCNDPTIFKPVLHDDRWKVTWYKLAGG